MHPTPFLPRQLFFSMQLKFVSDVAVLAPYSSSLVMQIKND